VRLRSGNPAEVSQAGGQDPRSC